MHPPPQDMYGAVHETVTEGTVAAVAEDRITAVVGAWVVLTDGDGDG